jgi:hypothetical protein
MGLEKGIENQKAIDESKRLAYIKNMLKMGLGIEQIAKILNEKIDFIKQIKEKLNKNQ